MLVSRHLLVYQDCDIPPQGLTLTSHRLFSGLKMELVETAVCGACFPPLAIIFTWQGTLNGDALSIKEFLFIYSDHPYTYSSS